MKLMENNECIVLTGAGFTKNFGGYLGIEIWTKILNHPLIQKKSRQTYRRMPG